MRSQPARAAAEQMSAELERFHARVERLAEDHRSDIAMIEDRRLRRSLSGN